MANGAESFFAGLLSGALQGVALKRQRELENERLELEKQRVDQAGQQIELQRQRQDQTAERLRAEREALAQEALEEAQAESAQEIQRDVATKLAPALEDIERTVPPRVTQEQRQEAREEEAAFQRKLRRIPQIEKAETGAKIETMERVAEASQRLGVTPTGQPLARGRQQMTIGEQADQIKDIRQRGRFIGFPVEALEDRHSDQFLGLVQDVARSRSVREGRQVPIEEAAIGTLGRLEVVRAMELPEIARGAHEALSPGSLTNLEHQAAEAVNALRETPYIGPDGEPTEVGISGALVNVILEDQGVFGLAGEGETNITIEDVATRLSALGLAGGAQSPAEIGDILNLYLIRLNQLIPRGEPFEPDAEVGALGRVIPRETGPGRQNPLQP